MNIQDKIKSINATGRKGMTEKNGGKFKKGVLDI